MNSILKNNPLCPYCDKILEKQPARKKKCPHCSEYIFVRRGELYTEKEVMEKDFTSKWLYLLERYRVTEQTIYAERKKLSDQFGSEASLTDTIWRILNKLALEQRSSHDFEQIYLLMGKFMQDEGKDPTTFAKKAMEARSESVRQQVIGFQKNLSAFNVRVSVHTANDDHVCKSCKKASEKKYEIKEFLEKMPIPNHCENPSGCRCGVSANFDNL